MCCADSGAVFRCSSSSRSTAGGLGSCTSVAASVTGSLSGWRSPAGASGASVRTAASSSRGLSLGQPSTGSLTASANISSKAFCDRRYTDFFGRTGSSAAESSGFTLGVFKLSEGVKEETGSFSAPAGHQRARALIQGGAADLERALLEVLLAVEVAQLVAVDQLFLNGRLRAAGRVAVRAAGDGQPFSVVRVSAEAGPLGFGGAVEVHVGGKAAPQEAVVLRAQHAREGKGGDVHGRRTRLEEGVTHALDIWNLQALSDVQQRLHVVLVDVEVGVGAEGGQHVLVGLEADAFDHQRAVAQQTLDPLLLQLLQQVGAVAGHRVHGQAAPASPSK
ncbi:hypothetical protein EYF80_054338 [Liparis tanakae]|uniref:Uncharacterized protein n=1 Tax=Liparis tanakae TaxID=230148 RepID=A0A4Z2F4U5_9TELE|nr:hypothetical protein EYF80_054338 [Liparis tanakae]